MDEVCRQIKTKLNIDPQKINLVSGAGVNINDVSKAYVDLQDNLLRQQINAINNELLIQIGNEKTERINNDNSILQDLAGLDDKKQDKLTAGEQINITADNIISAVIADASETTKGLIRIATVEEVTAGNLDNIAITPQTLANTMAPIKEIVNVNTKEFLGNATSATKLATPRSVNGTAFDGTANISFGRLEPILIAAGTDLNTVLNSGLYRCDTNGNVATLINCPTGNAFSLFVSQTTNAGVHQALTEFLTSKSVTYYRNKYNEAWGAWYQNIDSNNIVDYASQKITFTATDSRWGALSNGVYPLTLATGGREIVVVMRSNEGVYEQIVAGAKVRGNNRIVESMNKFAGYVICI